MEIVEEGKDRISFQYNASQGRAAMYWGGTQEDKLQRRYRRYYSADGSMEITQDLMSNKTTFVTYLGGDAYTAPAIWRSEQTSTTEGIFYLFRDYLGSILAITDVNGTIKEKRHFDAWEGQALKKQPVAVFSEEARWREGFFVTFEIENGNALSSFTLLDRGYTGRACPELVEGNI